MNQQTADDIAAKAAKKALDEFKAENKRQKRYDLKRRTRKLLGNYNSIKEHVDKGVSEVLEAEIDFTKEELDEDDLYIASIRRSKIRSLVYLAHIEKCLALLEVNQKKKGTPEKYKVFYGHYVNVDSYEELSSTYDCDERTARRWVTELEGLISVYLFGIDGLSFD